MSNGKPRGISRRSFLRNAARATTAGAAIVLVGCSDDTTRVSTTTTEPSAPPSSPRSTTATANPKSKVRSWSLVVPEGVTPGARRDHSLTLAADRHVYLFGGRLTGESLNDLWAFDTATSSWSRIDAENSPPARFAHTATWDAARNRLVIATGQGSGGALYNDAWAFDPLAKRWTEITSASGDRPEIRYGSGGAHDAAGARLLVSHGFTDAGRFDDTWSLDLASGTWSKSATSGALPIKRCLLRSTWIAASKQMLLFGGQTDSNPFLGDFWSLDVAGGSWNELKPSVLPGPRNLYGASLDEAGKRWYVVAGNTPDGASSEAWMYDVAAGGWSAGDDPLSSMMLPPRYSADAVVVGSALFVYGGSDGTVELGDMWTLPVPV